MELHAPLLQNIPETFLNGLVLLMACQGRPVWSVWVFTTHLPSPPTLLPKGPWPQRLGQSPVEETTFSAHQQITHKSSPASLSLPFTP